MCSYFVRLPWGAKWEDHWAYVLPKKHPTPRTKDSAWPRNLIDSFILARLEQEKLRPSPEADKHLLLRRLSFDLVGLPPSESDVQDFLSDKTPRAYERAVDRLLTSPHYGEHMAVHWLDLVRYADTVGFHADQNVSVSPYRDYVINAFNTNMRFDQFTREQLAGDLLPDPTRDQLVASGYNKLGMMSAEVGVQPKEYLAKYAADRVRTASAVWLGSTVGCTECHDHKFDPFTTRDFYRFASFFTDIKERGLYSGAGSDGNWGPKIDVPNEQLPGLLKPIDQQLNRLQSVLDTPTDKLTAAQSHWERELSTGYADWKTLKPTTVRARNGGTQLKVLKDDSILASGGNPDQNTYTLIAKSSLKNITGFRVEVLPDKSLPRNGPGRADNGNFVITEFRVTQQTAAEEKAVPIGLENASATFEQAVSGKTTPYGKWSATAAIDGDTKGPSWGWAVLPEVGKPNNLVVETKEPVGGEQETTFTFVIEQNHENGKHTLGRFRISATSSPHPLKARKINPIPKNIEDVLAIAPDKRNNEQTKMLAAYYRTLAPLLAETQTQIENLKQQKQQAIKANTRTSLITVAVEPRVMRVLNRGDWMDESGEIVLPGAPKFLNQLPEKERATRLDFADWLTDEDNPLTARVFVNRLWKNYFGTGLSKTLDDLGSQGEFPTHPELLDRLAVEFVSSGWNIKEIVKLMVMCSRQFF